MVCDAIIVNYNAGPLLRASVESLLDSPAIGRVVVVDNASVDGSVESLQGLPRVVTLPQSRNLGFAAGCNAALAETRSDRLLFLNPDCVVAPGALETLLAAFDARPRCGMVGPRVLNPDGSEQRGARRAVPTPWRAFVRAFGLAALARRAPRLSRRFPRLFSDFSLDAQALPDGPIDVDAISGACMLVRREALDDVGPLDAGYFMHCEDLDWCIRFRRRGWQILFVPSAIVTHHKGVSSRSRPYFVEWHKHRGMLRYYRKHFRDRYPAPMLAVVAAGIATHFALVVTRQGLVDLRRRMTRRRPNG